MCNLGQKLKKGKEYGGNNTYTPVPNINMQNVYANVSTAMQGASVSDHK